MPGEVFVVDASAMAALLFDEPSGRAVARILEGGHLAAPAILPCELASVTLKKIALRPEQEPGLRAAARLFERMGVDLVAVPIEAIVRIARRTGLSAYDAAYVWLAAELEAVLVTLDRSLKKGARRMGVRCRVPVG
jgi:predicted nucleic acid-binding protein